jgi:hypothetical protein
MEGFFEWKADHSVEEDREPETEMSRETAPEITDHSVPVAG